MENKYKLHIINTEYNKSANNTTYYKINKNASYKLDKKSPIRSNPIFRSFILPFFYIGWIISCVIKGSKIINNKKIDIIYVSQGPPSILIVGYLLKRKYKKCKLITDYRDSWTDNPYRKFPSRLIKKFLENIEYDVLKKSNLIIVVNTYEKIRFTKKYGHVENKIKIIRNGFFNIDIPSKKDTNIFKITHSGSFYGSRKPDAFLSGYKSFLEKINREKVKAFFIGNLDEENVKKIQKQDLIGDSVLLGTISYKEALSNIHNSDLLVVIEYTETFPMKIYDYLSSGNPILAITQNIELIKFIKKYSTFPVIISDNNIEKIDAGIMEVYSNWKNNTVYNFEKKHEYFKKYSRKTLAKKLEKYIEMI